VGRTEEDTDSTRTEMVALLEVLVGSDVKKNVMVDNQCWHVNGMMEVSMQFHIVGD